MLPVAWLVSSAKRRHVSVHLDVARAAQAAAELHGTVEPLLRESDVLAFIDELREKAGEPREPGSDQHR